MTSFTPHLAPQHVFKFMHIVDYVTDSLDLWDALPNVCIIPQF